MSSLHHKATFAAQKNFSSACFLCLFIWSIQIKVQHTHSNVRSYARVIYNIITYKQRVCKKFFINFLHALFACKNERIYAQKNGMISIHSK